MDRPDRSLHTLRFAVVLLAALSFSSCKLSTDAPVAHTALIQGGDQQTAPAGTAFATPLTILIVDQYGFVMPNVPVTWAILNGGGSLSATTTQTDADGTSSVIYTAGPNPGAARVTATIAGIGILTFDETIS